MLTSDYSAKKSIRLSPIASLNSIGGELVIPITGQQKISQFAAVKLSS